MVILHIKMEESAPLCHYCGVEMQHYFHVQADVAFFGFECKNPQCRPTDAQGDAILPHHLNVAADHVHYWVE